MNTVSIIDALIKLDGLREIPSDPNAKQNRIPEGSELDTLQKLVQHNLRLIKKLDSELEQRKNDRAAIQKRYKEQLQVLEGIQSELSALDSFMEMLEKQKGLMETELNRIKVPMHPIRTCPTDIFRIIFEWTVQMPSESNWFVTATRLSQVCQRWRNIALDTSYLWRYIEVSLLRDPEEVNVFWDRTVGRAKAAPMSIHIYDITDGDAQWDVMGQCHLDRFSCIENLEVVITKREAVARFASPQFDAPTGRLDKLSVRYAGYDLNEPLNLSPLMGRLPSTTWLELFGLPNLTLGPDFVAPSVIKLTVEGIKISSVNLLVETFPNAEEVDFDEVSFGPDADGNTTTWPKLQTLTISTCYKFPWRSLQAPRITSLSWLEYGSEADITAFITSHQSLRHMDASYHESYTKAMLAASPQLLTLTIDHCDEICDRSLPALEKLTNLAIYHVPEDPIPLDRFERIVRSRFLPTANVDGTQDRCPSLTVLVQLPAESSEIQWQRSELLSFANQSISTIDHWDHDYHAYCFDWNTMY